MRMPKTYKAFGISRISRTLVSKTAKLTEAFGSVAYMPILSLKLDRVQYAAAKVVTGVRHQASKNKLNNELAWEEIGTRATYLGLTLFQKIANHETRPLIRACMPQRSTLKRLDTFTHFPFKGMNYAKSYFPFFTKAYNSLFEK